MPCDSVTTQRISAGLAKAIPAILAAALTADGWRIVEQTANYIRARHNETDNVLEWTQGQPIVITTRRSIDQTKETTRLTKAYSAAALSWASQRVGFSLAKTADNKYVATRR